MNLIGDKRNLNWLHFYLFLAIFASLLLRIYLAFHLEGYERDQLFFVDWMNTVGKYGLGDVYAHGDLVNYPPFFLALLGIYGEILSFLNIHVEAAGVLIRIPSIVFEVVAIIIFAIVSKRIDNSIMRAALVTFFAFSPAVIVDGTIWGQVDMLHSILMVSSILLLMSKPTWSGAIYAIALLAKFQSIVIAPVFAMYFLKIIWEKKEGKQLTKFVIGFCIPLLLFGLYFAAYGTFITMLKQAYLNAVGTFPTVTVFAMNIWYYAIGTDPNTVDTIQILPHITLKTVGLILLSIAAALTCLYIFFHRHMNTAVLLKAATFISFAFFMLPTQIHERYAFPALVFVIFLLLYEMKWTGIALGLTLTIFFNIVMVLYAGFNTNMGMFIVIINVFIFYAMCKLLVKEYYDRFELLIKKQ